MLLHVEFAVAKIYLYTSRAHQKSTHVSRQHNYCHLASRALTMNIHILGQHKYRQRYCLILCLSKLSYRPWHSPLT